MSHAEQTALILFARGPQPGKVKTRLAATLGELAAARLYAVLLGRSLRLLAAWPGPRILACADASSRAYFSRLPEAGDCELHLQVEADLGTRMATALTTALAASPQALLMGSDLLDIEMTDLRAAADCLRGGADAVFGPVADGGYWLVGLRRSEPRLFAGIEWSTPRVLQETLVRAQTLGLRWRELPRRHDLDLPSDLHGFEDLLERNPPLPLMSREPDPV